MPIPTMDPAMQQAIMAQMAGRGPQNGAGNPYQAQGTMERMMPMPGAPVPTAPPAPPAPEAQPPAPAAKLPVMATAPPMGMMPGQMAPTPVASAGGGVDNSPEAMAARKADMDRVNQGRAALGMPTSGQQADGGFNMMIQNGGTTQMARFPGAAGPVGVSQGGPAGIGVPNQPPGASPMGQPPSAGPGPLTDYQSFMNANRGTAQARSNLAAGLDPSAEAGSYRMQKQPDGTYKSTSAYVDPESMRPEYNQQLGQQTALQNESALRARTGGLGGDAGVEAMKEQSNKEGLVLQAVNAAATAAASQGLPFSAQDAANLKSMMDANAAAPSTPTAKPGVPQTGSPQPDAPQAPQPGENEQAAPRITKDQMEGLKTAIGAGDFNRSSAYNLASFLRKNPDLVGRPKDVANALKAKGVGDTNAIREAMERTMISEMNSAGVMGKDPSSIVQPQHSTAGAASGYTIKRPDGTTVGYPTSMMNDLSGMIPGMGAWHQPFIPAITEQQKAEATANATALQKVLGSL